MTIYPVPKPVPVPRERHRLRSKKRMKAKNAKRGGHAFPKNVDQKYRSWIRTLPCILAGRTTVNEFFGNALKSWHTCMGRVQACHVKSRGAGGKDLGNIFPGCAYAHDEQHYIGIPAFERRWKVKLASVAAGLALKYQETGGA